MENERSVNDSIKEAIKKKIKEKLKEELLEEIYEELKLGKIELPAEDKPLNKKTHSKKPAIKKLKKEVIEAQMEENIEREVFISVKAILKVASHALKYANSKVPKEKWVEVIGLLAGKIDNTGMLYIEDVYPIGHGNAIYVEMDETRNRKTGHIKAYEEISKNKLFICGWYHSHPSYGCFMSKEDMGTQARYQKHWDKAVALVIDPYLIDGSSAGFEIYRANLKTKEWFPLVYGIKGALDIRMLPEILEFMRPIIEGKPAYLEYDED